MVIVRVDRNAAKIQLNRLGRRMICIALKELDLTDDSRILLTRTEVAQTNDVVKSDRRRTNSAAMSGNSDKRALAKSRRQQEKENANYHRKQSDSRQLPRQSKRKWKTSRSKNGRRGNQTRTFCGIGIRRLRLRRRYIASPFAHYLDADLSLSIKRQRG